MQFLHIMGSDKTGLYLYVTPKASKNRVLGIVGLPNVFALKIAIAQPPTDNRANVEIVRFLSDYFGVAKSHVNLIKGHSSKMKFITIEATTEFVGNVLNQNGWMFPNC